MDLDNTTFNGTLINHPSLPLDFTELARNVRCLYLARLSDPDHSLVADFELDPSQLDFSSIGDVARFEGFSTWLKSAVSETYDTPNVLVNVNFKI